MKLNYKDKLYTLFLLSPWLLTFTIFWLYPLLFALWLSLTDYSSLTGDFRFVGLLNFRRVFSDPDFWNAFKNTTIFTIGTVPITTILALGFAYLLDQKFIILKKFLRTVYFMPSITSIVVIALIFANLYSADGYINNILRFFGLSPPEFGFLQNPSTALPSIMLMDIWMSVGYYTIILLAGIQSIPQDYFDVADLAGASHWQKLKKVVIPSVSPTLIFVVILNTIKSFQIFVEIYIMTKGGPLGATSTLVYLIYENAFVKMDQMGYASAMAFIIFAILIVFSLLQIRLLRLEK
ncbi:MAG: carbohydrate ABC transporter permease [Candidatus Kapaibacteriales bacterium]